MTKIDDQTDGYTNGERNSKTTSKDVEEMRVVELRVEPPQMDKGLVPWIQCLGCSCLWMGTWGLANSFGVFQTYYLQRFPDQSASSISWIGSLQLALFISLGVIIGPIYDAGYLRSLVLVGSIISVLAMMLTSLCTKYWQLVLAQGLFLGIGNGCLFIPSFAILPSYFVKKRSLALGLAASGSALGGVIFPIVFHQLQPRVGFGWAVRVIAFIMLFVFILPVTVLRMRSQAPAIRRMFDILAWREKPFFLTGISLFFLYLGTYIPAFYIQLYAIEKGIVDEKLGFYLLPLLNVGSLFGRIIPPHIADKFGVHNTSIFCVIFTSLLGFVWISVHNTAGVIIFAIFYGFFSGGIAGLTVSLVVPVTPNLSQFGVRFGMMLIPVAMGLLFGNPIAGVLQSKSWLGLQVFTGTMQAVAVGSFVVVKLVLYGRKWDEK